MVSWGPGGRKNLRALAARPWLNAALGLAVVIPGLLPPGGLRGVHAPNPAPKFRHVILFIGDGMSLAAEVSASRYLYGHDRGLAWHSFEGKSYVATWDATAYNRNAKDRHKPKYSEEAFSPSLGYDVNREGRRPHPIEVSAVDRTRPLLLRPSTDSAAAATALATGHKTEAGRVSWRSGKEPAGPLTSILEEARALKGASAGVVSTVPFNHATPAPFVSHNISRVHYYTGYKTYTGVGIADEIIHTTKPDVVIGGGHPLIENPSFDPKKGYISADLVGFLRSSQDYVFVERRPGVDGGRALLEAADRTAAEGKRLFGLFGGESGNFETPIAGDSPGAPAVRAATEENPSLREAALAALRVLGRDPDGFFLMLEQGDIDWANHDNDFGRMIGAMSDLEAAVRAVMAFVDEPDDDISWTNTVLLVTADHATGWLRLNPDKPLGKGDLPRQVRLSPEEIKSRRGASKKGLYVSPFDYPDAEVSYSTSGHANELVTLSVAGPAARLVLKYKGWWYPGPIIDNTQVNAILRDALGLGSS